MAVRTLFPSDQSASNVKVLDIWNKNVQHISSQLGKSKALAATLSDIEPKIESNDSDNEGILNAFTATVDPTKKVIETVDDEEDLVVSKFEKIYEQDDIHTAYAKLDKVFEKHEILYRLAIKKLSDVEIEMSTL